jgi:tryptophanyl-tRNA synthetase
MIADKAYLQEVYTEGAQRAGAVARRTLRKVYKKIGLVEKPF